MTGLCLALRQPGNQAEMLPLVWGLWCLTALIQGPPASAAFLPPSVERLFQVFSNIMEQSREALGKSSFEPSVDISKLPSNYHNEEKQQRKVGNATVYSHHEISKVTNNRTGEMLFSEKTVTSIEQGAVHSEERGKECVSDNDCQKDQFCFKSLLASWCQQCKAKDMICRKDGECCLGYLCVWGKCAEGVSRGESGTRCNPRREECAQGLCCTLSNSTPFPVCTPYPKEGEACQFPSGTLLGRMGWGRLAAFAKPSQYCPCAQGLKCGTKRYSTVSTCEKPEDNVDISNLGLQLPFFQSILIRRDKEDADYDNSRQDGGELAIVNMPRGLYTMEDIGQAKQLSEDYDEKGQLPWEEDMDNPNQPDFQELKQLANQMGQYIGPGFY
ncbi:dickkopf-like protein 1 isoform X2 [Hemicordylus capensis]|uniref:dickkopf-like protein 1 isoform X2 n=1 Tax=Hemicordylus capensis TaxID=884348 RepID=UPI0023030A46|nr:dickkopf-like protein 1 isoform X2 [Hemicordylus capensis]